MKILIHGRKNGYTVLYPKPTPTEFYSFASDIQSISANNYDVYYGRNFYTLAFVDNGCVFTKYVIGDDVERRQLGEIGISVFISNTQKLSGVDVKTLLDELINTYSRNYISNHKIDEPKNGFDWLLFTSLANDCDAKLLSRSTSNDDVSTGTQDPAFHYYKSDTELIALLDKPFQEEYSGYRQILFIDSNFQGASNPLNVLKNSGVEVNPDLNNEYYYLANYNSNKGIKITANGKPRSDRKGENQIRAKWQVEIKYARDFYKPIVESGCLSNLDSGIYKYLEKNGSNIKIKYDAFLSEPETKTISFYVVTKKDGAKVTDAEIQIGEYQNWQRISEYTFKAEELGKEYRIKARKGDNLVSDVLKITPKDLSAASIPMQLIEKRVVKIIATDEENGNVIWQLKVHITGKDFYEVTDQIEFVGDEIDKVWNIQIEKRKEYADSENINFCPAKDGNEIIFKLKKAKTQTNGTSKGGDRSDVPGDKGGKQKSSFVRMIPKKWGFIAIGIIVVVICIGALYSFFGKDKQPKEMLLNKEEIEMYVEGDSLILEKLNAYKENWEKQKPEIETIGGTVWYNPTTWFVVSNEAKPDSTEYKKWDESLQNIDRAIIKRKFLNDKDFAELKNLRYSDDQQIFKFTVEKIDSTQYREVGSRLGDVSALTLTQIAKKINEILKPKRSATEEPLQKPEKKGTKPPQNIVTSIPEKKTDQPNPQKQKTPATEKSSEIIQYIKDSKLKKETLNQYLKVEGINKTLQASIKLCLKLWSLDGKKNNSYSSYQVELNKDINLKNSKLNEFVDEMCKEKKPKYIKELPESDQIKSLSQIKSKLK